MICLIYLFSKKHKLAKKVRAWLIANKDMPEWMRDKQCRDWLYPEFDRLYKNFQRIMLFEVGFWFILLNFYNKQ